MDDMVKSKKHNALESTDNSVVQILALPNQASPIGVSKQSRLEQLTFECLRGLVLVAERGQAGMCRCSPSLNP